MGNSTSKTHIRIKPRSDARLDLSGRILAVGIPASAYDNDRHRPHSASYQKSRPRQASSDAFWDVTDTEVAQNPS